MKTPYISVIFANRNDGYGGDQLKRFDSFVRYYSHFDKKYPCIFEFVICDWNPPSNMPPLESAIDWTRLGNVVFTSVSQKLHEKFAEGVQRPIFDYVARNVAIRRATAPWVMIVNQDIFPTPGIFDFIGKKRLNSKYFYRADRVDFDFSEIFHLEPEEFIRSAQDKVICRHRRQNSLFESNISKNIGPQEFLEAATKPQVGEKDDWRNNLILGDWLGRLGVSDRICHRFGLPLLRDPDRHSGSTSKPETFFHRYKLHTNAAGDFVIVKKKGFDQTYGCPERKDFYLHTDCYLVVNLFMARYYQAIFTGPEVVFHADHARRDHNVGNWTWTDHQKLISNICRSGQPQPLSSVNWGLGNEPLPIKRVNEGRYL